MKFLKQSKTHSESVKGNCMATCIACILDLEITDVPQFEEINRPQSWEVALISWLIDKGYYIHADYPVKYSDGDKKVIEMPNDLCIVGGKSTRGDLLHAVIYKDGKLYHDPHPDNTGVLTVDDYWLIYPIEGNQAGTWYGFKYNEVHDLLKDY